MPRTLIKDFGTCLSFNGTSSFVVGANLVNTTTATIAAWINLPTKTPAVISFIAGFMNGNGNASLDKNLYIDTSGNLRFYVYDGAVKNTPISAATVLPWGQWVHVAATADGTNAIVYINGVNVGSVAAGNTFTGYTVPNMFANGDASAAGASAHYMKALMDDVRFYTRGLSAAEVANLALNIEPSTTGLVSYWKFDEGSGTSATDSSGSGNTGTITAGTYSTNVVMKARSVAA